MSEQRPYAVGRKQTLLRWPLELSIMCRREEAHSLIDGHASFGRLQDGPRSAKLAPCQDRFPGKRCDVCQRHGGQFSSSSDRLSCSFSQPPELDHSQEGAASAFCRHVLHGSFQAHLQELDDIFVLKSYTCLLSR
jgi:hypothetical protein